VILTPKQFERKFKKWQKKFPEFVYQGLEKAAIKIVARAQGTYLSGPKSRTRLGVVTGTLRKSITYKMRKNPVMASVGTNLVYAPIHEYGGTIRAKGSGYLRFKMGDKWVTTKSVKIPARPYLRPSIKDQRQQTEKYIADAVVQGYGRLS